MTKTTFNTSKYFPNSNSNFNVEVEHDLCGVCIYVKGSNVLLVLTGRNYTCEVKITIDPVTGKYTVACDKDWAREHVSSIEVYEPKGIGGNVGLPPVTKRDDRPLPESVDLF